MAQQRDGWRVRIRELMFNVRSLLQLALWGTTAAGAVVFAALAASSHTGSQRLSAVLRTPAQAAEHTKAELAARAAEAERHRLTQSVQALTADRDRLLSRMADLEQSLKDLTGSIKRQQAAAQALPPPVPAKPPTPAPASVTASSPSVTPAASPLLALAKATTPPSHVDASLPPLPPVLPTASGHAAASLSAAVAEKAAAASRRTDGELMPEEAAQPELGVDLGGSTTLVGLRALWKSVRSSHERLMEDLQPLVTVRDNSGGRGWNCGSLPGRSPMPRQRRGCAPRSRPTATPAGQPNTKARRSPADREDPNASARRHLLFGATENYCRAHAMAA